MNPNHALVDTGIDWITCTFSDPKNRDRALNRASRLMFQEAALGNDKKPWRGFGYEGFASGGIRFGRRYEDDCVILSGPCAHLNWQRFYPLASNVSRLDLQATIRYGIASSSKIAQHYKRAVQAHRKKISKRRVTLLRSTDQSATIYIGSRQSESFGRVYQKDAESKLDHYQDAVRYEVELKNDRAFVTIRELDQGGSFEPHAFSIVRKWFSDSQVFFPSLLDFRNTFLCIPTTRTDNDRRLAWLKSDVAPAIETLVASGRLVEVLDALRLSDLVQPVAGNEKQN